VPVSTRHDTESVDVSGLHEQVRAILDEARHRVARSVNIEMVHAYPEKPHALRGESSWTYYRLSRREIESLPARSVSLPESLAYAESENSA